MTTQTMILKIKDEMVRTQIENIVSAIPGYVIEFDETTPCDLMIFEITDKDAEKQFDFIRGAVSSGMAGHVFLVSGAVDPNVLVQALKIRAKEFFQLPLNHEDVTNALVKFRAIKSSDRRVSDKPARES